jgi:hypothetical protein
MYLDLLTPALGAAGRVIIVARSYERAPHAIPRGYRIRPEEAIQAWLAASGITDGPVFRPILKGDRLQATPLSAFSAAQIVKGYAERTRLDPALFGGHSLRADFLTSAAISAGPPYSRNIPAVVSCEPGRIRVSLR